MNEQEQFLKELEPKQSVNDILEAPLMVPEEGKKEEAPKVEDKEGEEGGHKNRRERRMEKALADERQAGRELASKLETMSEALKTLTKSDSEYLKAIDSIYGTDTPEKAAATEILKRALLGVKDEATREALDTFRSEQQKEREAIKKEEAELDSMIEDLEDSYSVDLSSATSSETRKGFFKLLGKLSPKDQEGNIIQYADHHAVWEQFQAGKTKTVNPETNRAKDLASRSMVNSGSSPDSKVQDDAQLRFLKANGII